MFPRFGGVICQTGANLQVAEAYQIKEDQLQPSVESAEQAEIRCLRRENEILRQERDILKETIQVFSRGSRTIGLLRQNDVTTRYGDSVLCYASGFYTWLKHQQSPASAGQCRFIQTHPGDSHPQSPDLRVSVMSAIPTR